MTTIGTGTIGGGTIGNPGGSAVAVGDWPAVPFIVTGTATVSEPDLDADTAGDDTELWVARATAVPCHVAEKGQRVFLPTEGRWTTVRVTRVLLAPGCPIEKGWRVELDGLGDDGTFTTTHVFEHDATLLGDVVRADLERTTG